MSNRIREIRERAGISQSSLAKRLEMDRQRLFAYETKGVNPPVTVALAIARELGVTVEELDFRPVTKGSMP